MTTKTAFEVSAKEVCSWLKATGHEVAGFTGQDIRTLVALNALWDLWATVGGITIILSAKALFSPEFLQTKYWSAGVELVAKAANWEDRARVAHHLATGRGEEALMLFTKNLKQIG